MKVAQYVVIICLTYHNIIVADVVPSYPDYKINEKAGGWLKVHRFPVTWRDAMLRCNREGAVLASPLNDQLAYAVHTLMLNNGMNRIFLGTHELFSGGEFVSVEGVPVADMGLKWGWQNISHGSCLIMSTDMSSENNGYLSGYIMYASSCTEPLPYICYRKFDNRTMNECGTFDNEYQYSKTTGSCYKVHLQVQDWPTAYKRCATEGAYLVVLNDKEEERVVHAMFPATQIAKKWEWDKIHIGLVAWGVERIWLTIHGDRIEDVFHHWYSDQPNSLNDRRNRGTLLREGTLFGIFPEAKFWFVCEKAPESIRFETPEDTIIL